jgi:phage major head subunit gpT-like protein
MENGTINKRLRESNAKVIKRALTEGVDVREYRKGFAKAHGFDPLDAKSLPVMESGFSWKKVADKFNVPLKEAEQSTGFVQVLRAGVLQIANSMYESVATSYEDWVTVVNSAKDTELYAPLHGVNFPREVAQGGLYPEVNVQGLDIKLQNRKYGTMFAITKELMEDDQTGQFQRQAALMGEYLKVLTEVLVYAKLASPSGGVDYINLHIPASETQPSSESVYPWSTALQGGGATRPASFGAFNQANIQNGVIALMGQKNLLGLLMQVNPNRLIVAPSARFDAAILLHSGYYPSGAAAAGSTGGAFAINPIQGLADLTVSRYIPNSAGAVDPSSKRWFLIDDSKPWFVLQLREAISLVPEAANSGQSFERDIMRFKASMRGNADHIDPRFAWMGSDGSV